MSGKITFEFEFTIGNLEGKETIKMYPEKDNNGLYSTGRYICKEDLDSYHDNGEWEADCHDTTHFDSREKALSCAIGTMIKSLISLEEMQKRRNQLSRQMATLKKDQAKIVEENQTCEGYFCEDERPEDDKWLCHYCGKPNRTNNEVFSMREDKRCKECIKKAEAKQTPN